MRLPKPHVQMYVIAPQCPHCRCVPLHKGHDCGGGKLHPAEWKDPCPRCGRETQDHDHQELCFLCPFCRNCCTALRHEVHLARYLRRLTLPN